MVYCPRWQEIFPVADGDTGKGSGSDDIPTADSKVIV